MDRESRAYIWLLLVDAVIKSRSTTNISIPVTLGWSEHVHKFIPVSLIFVEYGYELPPITSLILIRGFGWGRLTVERNFNGALKDVIRPKLCMSEC